MKVNTQRVYIYIYIYIYVCIYIYMCVCARILLDKNIRPPSKIKKNILFTIF